MANARSDVATRLRSRRWIKVGITSFSFIAAVVGAFYLGSQHRALPIGNAPQSAVMRDTPANASKGTDDANALASPARAPDAQGSDAAHVPTSRSVSVATLRELTGDNVNDTVTTIDPETMKPIVTDRWGDVVLNLAGTADGLNDLSYEINDLQTSIKVNDLTADEVRNKEDFIASQLIFAEAKKALPGASDSDIMAALHANQQSRSSVAREIARAHRLVFAD